MKSMNKNKKIVIASALVVVVIAAVAVFYFMNSSRDTEVVRNCTTFSGLEGERCAEDYIGLSQIDAIAKAREDGLNPKIPVSGNQGGTDEAGHRVYFKIENGVVVKASFERGDY
jgi:hypothetical protein